MLQDQRKQGCNKKNRCNKKNQIEDVRYAGIHPHLIANMGVNFFVCPSNYIKFNIVWWWDVRKGFKHDEVRLIIKIVDSLRTE